ncbi:MAG: ATP-binding protein [Vulcanimicrobiota bacterium]
MNPSMQALADQTSGPAVVLAEGHPAVYCNRAYQELFREGPTELTRSFDWTSARHLVDGVEMRLITFKVEGPTDRDRSLSERLVEAREEERSSLSREVHDGVLQCIIAARMVLGRVLSRVARATVEYEQLVSVDDCLIEASREGRKLLEELRPSAEAMSLAQAIRQFLERMTRESTLEFEFDNHLLPGDSFPPAIRSNLYRVTQECVRNVIKHSGAKKARISLGQSDEEAWVRVEDRGRGFEVGRTLQAGSHIGLASLRERATLLGGRCSIVSRPGRGSTVEIRVPLSFSASHIGFSRLKERAQALLLKRPSEPAEAAEAAEMSPEELGGLLHELQVRQLELELQNEQLQVAQGELEAARDRYRDLYQHAPIGYLEVDSEGLVVAANLTVSSMLGRSREELLGTPLPLLLRPKFRKQWQAHHPGDVQMLREAQPGWFWARLEGRPADQGRERRLAVTDISLLCQARESQARLQARLDLAHRRETQARHLGPVTPPLMARLEEIRQNAATLLTDLPVDSAQREPAGRIAAAGRQAAELCQQAAFPEHRQQQPVILDELLANLLPSLRCEVAPATLEFLPLARGAEVLADPARLAILVDNLLENAGRAIKPKSGRITLSSGVVRHNGQELAYLEVADTGAGMDAATRARIFEPFFTTEPNCRGLGLSEVLDIAKSHDGEVSVMSNPGRGTTVRVLFPKVPSLSPVEA